MNNKGQTMVLFVLLLPIILIILCLVVDISLSELEKNKIKNIVKETIRNEFNNDNLRLEDSKNRINSIINKNIENALIDLEISDNSIKVTILKDYKGILLSVLNKDGYKIKVSYKGYKVNDKIIIKREVK